MFLMLGSKKKKFQGGGGSDKYLWLPVGGRLLRPILVILLRKFKKFEILMGPPPLRPWL